MSLKQGYNKLYLQFLVLKTEKNVENLKYVALSL